MISDEGPGFDPNDVPDPTDIENLERPCGRGLMLMRHYMTEVNYNSTGNSVRMKKVFKKLNPFLCFPKSLNVHPNDAAVPGGQK